MAEPSRERHSQSQAHDAGILVPSCYALPGCSLAVAARATTQIKFSSARPLHPATPNDDLSPSATNSAISAIVCSGFKIADLGEPKADLDKTKKHAMCGGG